MVKDVRASLLANESFQEFCKNNVVAILTNENPESKTVANRFDLQEFYSWVIVHDAKKGSYARVTVGSCGAGCSRKSADQFPGMVVSKINDYLQRDWTYEEVVERVAAAPNDKSAWENLRSLAKETNQRGLLQSTYESVLESPDLSDEIRQSIYVDFATADPMSLGIMGVSYNPSQQQRIVSIVETYILHYSNVDSVQAMTKLLMTQGYAPNYDVPAFSEKAIARLREASKDFSADRQAKVNVALELLQVARATWINQHEQMIRQAKTCIEKGLNNSFSTNAGLYAALLGDAVMTLEHLDPKGEYAALYEAAEMTVETTE